MWHILIAFSSYLHSYSCPTLFPPEWRQWWWKNAGTRIKNGERQSEKRACMPGGQSMPDVLSIVGLLFTFHSKNNISPLDLQDDLKTLNLHAVGCINFSVEWDVSFPEFCSYGNKIFSLPVSYYSIKRTGQAPLPTWHHKPAEVRLD